MDLLGRTPPLDARAVSDYLSLQYIPAPATGLEGIFKLPAAHSFTYSPQKGLRISRYWDLEDFEPLDIPEQEFEQLIIRELEKCVTKRLISDVPLGAFLSGGIDSSAIVALMAKNSSKPVRTFSIGFDNKKTDETRHALTVAKRYKTDHHVFRVTHDILIDRILDVCSIYDEPIADNSILPTTILSEYAKKEVTVVLSGEGGDENFAGYDRYNIVKFGDYYGKCPRLIKDKMAPAGSRLLYRLRPTKFTERLNRFAETFSQDFFRRYPQYMCFFTNETKKDLFSPDFKRAVQNHDSFDVCRNFVRPQLNDLENALLCDIKSYLPDNLLYKTDAASMSVGLEVRNPFLDFEFVELMAKLPPALKIRGFNKKYILKKALVKNDLLPEEIVYRKKQGFNIPINFWFKGVLKKSVCDIILSRPFLELGIFEKKKLSKYVSDYFQSDLNYDNNMFALLFLAVWADNLGKE